MSIQSNIFCWQGISTDVNAAEAFYAGVLGWTAPPSADGPPVFLAPGGAVAHLQAPENGPAAWCSYLSVDDLDASTSRAAAHGSQVIVPPTDLPAGRFSIVTTPSGAVFALYQSAEADEMAKPGAGSIHWVELQSTAPEEDVAWLGTVFGFSSRVEEMVVGPYHVLEADGAPRGGVVKASGDVSTFVAWIAVDDLDATLAQVTTLGGRQLAAPTADPAVGRMALVADPSGAVFGIVQPSVRP